MNSSKKFIFYLLFSTGFLISPHLQALISNPFKTPEEAKIFQTKHYNAGCNFYNEQDWYKAIVEFEKVVWADPDCALAANAYYFLGVSCFKAKEYDFANDAFSKYLEASEQPEFFEDAISYKFCIAESFKAGSKSRLFKVRYCPKWASANSMALTIYDEIVMAVPNHPLAALSLYSKGCLLKTMRQYRESVEAFQVFIRRFPRHELVPQSYLNIARNYCVQSRFEFQNPDLLGLAELNARKFREEFPRDEKVELAEGYVQRMKENYGRGLCNLGLFYERIGAPDASAIYFRSSIDEFPDTRVADFCRAKLQGLGYEEEEEPALATATNEEDKLNPIKPMEPIEEEEEGNSGITLPNLGDSNAPS